MKKERKKERKKEKTRIGFCTKTNQKSITSRAHLLEMEHVLEDSTYDTFTPRRDIS